MLDDLSTIVSQLDSYKRYGKVKRVVGLMIESIGPTSSIGELCFIHTGKKRNEKVAAEVVGFKDELILLMPYSTIDSISSGSIVEATGNPLKIKVGSQLIGKVLDAFGQPMDHSTFASGLTSMSTDQEPPNPLLRPMITETLQIGIRSIDSLLTIGKGQRTGIFAGSGVGKSTMLGMISRNSDADLNVIVLVGERGREVKEFIEKDLGEFGLKRSILVVATSDQPPLMRIKAAYTATAVAEYFRDQGLNVMFMMDSVTRVATAAREIGLATGEPPTTKGYTPSVFTMLPKLLERTGTNENGSITAFYTVLVDGDDMNEPIADTVRGILDGHIVLDRQLANKGHFPAINVLKSVSRLMKQITDQKHQMLANQLRNLLSTYSESEDLISIGAYKKGSSQEIDQAVKYYPLIKEFLQQSTDEVVTYEDSITQLETMMDKGRNIH
ncbi:flagellar protein export ATPase FliI [Bacillus carboniphilus]|uniref:Flagellar protein export ATPase FliI n=1 Tax=Bacillus carboniphilus TaxID=86663 RepID=A0ABY9JVW3_9BACI|nr:flagellar protein export ATPase FliI [Bacillus carboniphilus]WLR43541.1 flagellar protein export ATPase FliI [Bacillus carboniphilus]